MQALETLPDIEDREKKVKKLEGKRGSLGGVVYAIAICVKRQVEPLDQQFDDTPPRPLQERNHHIGMTHMPIL